MKFFIKAFPYCKYGMGLCALRLNFFNRQPAAAQAVNSDPGLKPTVLPGQAVNSKHFPKKIFYFKCNI
jgi:hypothetical protein